MCAREGVTDQSTVCREMAQFIYYHFIVYPTGHHAPSINCVQKDWVKLNLEINGSVDVSTLKGYNSIMLFTSLLCAYMYIPGRYVLFITITSLDQFSTLSFLNPVFHSDGSVFMDKQNNGNN